MDLTLDSQAARDVRTRKIKSKQRIKNITYRPTLTHGQQIYPIIAFPWQRSSTIQTVTH
jgi:hypothetical protein